MSFPPYATTPPVLTTGQLFYGTGAGTGRDLAFGGVAVGATYQTQSITGIDGMPIVGGDVQKPLDWGTFAGIDTAAGRDITVSIVVRAATASALATARQRLLGIMQPQGNIEKYLWIAVENGTFACSARPEKAAYTWDVTTNIALASVVSLLFRSTDPRFYAATQEVNANYSALTLPFNLGAGAVLGGSTTTTVTNGAATTNCDSRPLLTFTGPLINPGCTNSTIPGSPGVSFGVTLLTGDKLYVDMLAQTAMKWLNGATSGTSVLNTLVAGSTWWNLQPGANTLIFTSGGVADVGSLAIDFAPAYAGL